MGGISKSTFVSAVSAAVIVVCHGALAADLPTHKAPPAPAPVVVAPNWGGFYIGVEGGATWADQSWNTTALATGFTPDNTNRASFSTSGGRVGVYLGYNFMVTPSLLTGVEGDFAGDFSGTKSISGIPGTLTYLNPLAPYDDTVKARGPSYDGSLRARFGALVTPNVLLYATGGLAFADSKYTINCPATANSWCANPENGSATPSQVGWTIGAGFEAMLANNWIARVEYRYSEFPGVSSTLFAASLPAGVDSITFRNRMSTNQVNVGIAYKF